VKPLEDVFRALADPTRRAVFEMLRKGPRTVGELAAELPVSRPAVSQHLKILKSAGLVGARPSGRRHYYEIKPTGLDPVRRYLEDFWDEVLTAFASHADQEHGGHDEH
jgi:DNA-binding transcriptional ArsR family regulator